MVVHYSRRLSPCQEQNQEFVCLISSSDGALLPGWTWLADSLRRFLPNHNRVLFNPSATCDDSPLSARGNLQVATICDLCLPAQARISELYRWGILKTLPLSRGKWASSLRQSETRSTSSLHLETWSSSSQLSLIIRIRIFLNARRSWREIRSSSRPQDAPNDHYICA